MKITYSNAKEYVLTADDDTFLGSLKYENWSYTKAEITTQFGEFFHIRPQGFWGTSIGISKGDAEYATLKMNWKGNVVIDLLENGVGTDYLLKLNSMWKSQYALVNRQEKEILILVPDYKWKKGHYDFKIDVNPDFADSVDEALATY